MTQPIPVKIENKVDYIWVTLPRTLNMDNYTQVEERINSNVQGKNLKVVIDLIDIQYLYSSGIGLLIRLRNNIAKNNGSLWLVNVNEKCKDNLTSMKLDKIFTIYSTDLEFELSQDAIWEDKLANDNIDFLCVYQIEDDICRINLSGRMTTTNNLSSFNSSIYTDTISYYVFDLTGLEMIDSRGAYFLVDFIMALKKKNAKCTAYGANDVVTELIDLIGIGEMIPCYKNESQALEALKKDDNNPQ